MKAKRTVLFLGLVLAGLAADLGSKAWIYCNPDLKQKDLLPGILRIDYTKNTGSAFGLFEEHNLSLLVISVVAVFLFTGYFFTYKDPSRLTAIAFALIVAGTIGNFYDRIAHAGVRDFIEFYLFPWPIFNIADSMITVGAGCFIAATLLEAPEKPKREEAQSPPAPEKTEGTRRRRVS